MTSADTERTGVFVVRAWIETGAGGGFRARVTRTLDLSTRDELSSSVATPSEITRLVVDWLDAFVADGLEVTER